MISRRSYASRSETNFQNSPFLQHPARRHQRTSHIRLGAQRADEIDRRDWTAKTLGGLHHFEKGCPTRNCRRSLHAAADLRSGAIRLEIEPTVAAAKAFLIVKRTVVSAIEEAGLGSLRRSRASCHPRGRRSLSSSCVKLKISQDRAFDNV
jgi:hypothetical protein